VHYSLLLFTIGIIYLLLSLTERRLWYRVAAVVAANGAMPVSLVAAARAGVDTRAIALGSDPRHVLAGERTRWNPIGDVVPVPLPWQAEVVSPGDVLIAAGLAELISVGMRRRST
jgi:hypothetical protein